MNRSNLLCFMFVCGLIFIASSAGAEAPICAQVVPDCDTNGNPQGTLADQNSSCYYFYKSQCLQQQLNKCQQKVQVFVSAGESLAEENVKCSAARCKASKRKNKKDKSS